MNKIAVVIGAGAFGTCIADLLSKKFEKVILIARSEEVRNAINDGENSIYLPGQKLASNLCAVEDWPDILPDELGKVSLIVSGLPTSAIDSYFSVKKEIIQTFLERGIPLVSLSKGIDPESLEFPDDLLEKYFYPYKNLLTYLSGPSFASEIVERQITLVSLAGKSREVLTTLAEYLNGPYFKVFLTYDVKGVLLGGALKNILAIAGGIIEGLGFNHNTRAAMISRGIAEMLRFGTVYNARPETFYGLSGMGDLILTTTGKMSRNKQFGIEISKGRDPQEIINSQRSVVEGYKTTKAAFKLSQRDQIRASIFNGVYQVLYEGAKPQEVIQQLMDRPVRFEID